MYTLVILKYPWPQDWSRGTGTEKYKVIKHYQIFFFMPAETWNIKKYLLAAKNPIARIWPAAVSPIIFSLMHLSYHVQPNNSNVSLLRCFLFSLYFTDDLDSSP